MKSLRLMFSAALVVVAATGTIKWAIGAIEGNQLQFVRDCVSDYTLYKKPNGYYAIGEDVQGSDGWWRTVSPDADLRYVCPIPSCGEKSTGITKTKNGLECVY